MLNVFVIYSQELNGLYSFSILFGKFLNLSDLGLLHVLTKLGLDLF